ncbi:MAG: hypothetical protein Q8N05_04730 [Bacteroidota bacterium]|nr:hypothetical protein [Bacteroidota bacterium]
MKWIQSIAWLVLIVLSAPEIHAQEVLSTGSRYEALADASVGLSDCWSVFGNQAGLAGIDRPEIAGSFQNRFLVNELSARTGLLVIPVQSSVFAVSLYQFGKTPFRQEQYGITYAQRIFPKLNFGVQFNYYRLFLSEDNRSVGSAGLELGIQYLFSGQLVVGFHVLNPYQAGIKMFSGNFYYPSRFNFGGLYNLSESFSIASEVGIDFHHSVRIKTGLEYKILEKFFLRTGISGKPYQLSAGIGFQVRKLIFDMASTYNQYLGNSPSVSFQYQF